MRISQVRVKNFRLFRDFSIDLEELLSVVVGQNNTGKTSLLTILKKCLSDSAFRFLYDDFNNELKAEIEKALEAAIVEEGEYTPYRISVRVLISYDENDNLSTISNLITDLDPENKVVVLGFDYSLDYTGLMAMYKEYHEFKKKEANKKVKDGSYLERTLKSFLSEKQAKFFKSQRKSIHFDHTTNKIDEDNFIDLDEKGVKLNQIINFQFISAKRSVTNEDSNKTLSVQTSKIYDHSVNLSGNTAVVESFKDTLSRTDIELTEVYTDIFKDVVERVKLFGGMSDGESKIIVQSSLNDRGLLEGNTTVMYDHDGTSLPESYNGLGYMNLISMIFEIELILAKFKRAKEDTPAEINLLFIEEPEAHTHPQMQYVFIKNIKSILIAGAKDSSGAVLFEIQSLLSTHSSHIISESNFDDIKYLKPKGKNGVEALNLKDLKEKYTDQAKYEFLQQYLTLHRSEAFFSSKLILIEGDTERIMFPAFLKKMDIECTAPSEKSDLPLCSQNISVLEVGAYAKIFEPLIEFIGVKTLIITDLDSVKQKESDGTKNKVTKKNVACRVAEGTEYSNSTLKYFFNSISLSDITKLEKSAKILSKDKSGKWTQDPDGSLMVVYQRMEGGVTARSYEESFIQVNKSFIEVNKSTFQGLQNVKLLSDASIDSYTLAEKCIKKKTHFALDVLVHSNKDYKNWQIPLYIKEGLSWLRK